MQSRLFAELLDHDKLERAADQIQPHGYERALGAFAWGCLYANHKLTDGRLPTRALVKYGISAEIAGALVLAGLWEADPNGYRIHDFLDWNPSANAVKAKLSKERLRKRRALGFRAEDDADGGVEGGADSARPSARNSERIPPLGVRPDRTGPDSDRTDVSTPLARTPEPAPATNGHTPRPSRGLTPPAPRNAAYAGRVCVPDFLDAEFERKGRKSYEERQAWYRDTEAAWADKAIGDTDLEFWRKRFAEWVPVTPSASRPKSFAAEAEDRAKAQAQLERDRLAERRREAARLDALHRQCEADARALEAAALRPRSPA